MARKYCLEKNNRIVRNLLLLQCNNFATYWYSSIVFVHTFWKDQILIFTCHFSFISIAIIFLIFIDGRRMEKALYLKINHSFILVYVNSWFWKTLPSFNCSTNKGNIVIHIFTCWIKLYFLFLSLVRNVVVNCI